MENKDDSYFPELKISPEQAENYALYRDSLLEAVNTSLLNRNDLSQLLGGCPVETMIINHRNHTDFMATVFRFNDFALLKKTLPWVYRSYHNYGFYYDYFLVELNAWIDAVKRILPQPVDEILAVYNWMIEQHEANIVLSKEPAPDVEPEDPHYRPLYAEFTEALLSGNVVKCMSLTNSIVHDTKSMLDFFTSVIQPAMYTIGARWENGIISVAQEHLASAIVARIISSIMLSNFVTSSTKIGKVVVSAAPNEFHEIGAWMVALALETEGWDVKYLGVNTPVKDLLEFIRREQPRLVCLSIAMVFNLEPAVRIIKTIRQDASLKDTKILVGGQAFAMNSNLVRIVGADAYAANCLEAKLLAKKLVT